MKNNRFLKGLMERLRQWRQWLVMLYLCVSFCSLGITDDVPVWVIVAVAVNFAVAGMLTRLIVFKEFKEFKEIKEHELSNI